MNLTRAAFAGLTLLALTACSSEGDGGSPAPAESPTASASETADDADATQIAEELRGASTAAGQVVTINEDNDPNDKIGRPNGYVSAAVLYDSEITCDSLGVDCGMTIEVYADEATARNRGETLQSQLAEMPFLGDEWDYLKGSVLLRISGELKPSSAENYAAKFGGEQLTAKAEPAPN